MVNPKLQNLLQPIDTIWLETVLYHTPVKKTNNSNYVLELVSLRVFTLTGEEHVNTISLSSLVDELSEIEDIKKKPLENPFRFLKINNIGDALCLSTDEVVTFLNERGKKNKPTSKKLLDFINEKTFKKLNGK